MADYILCNKDIYRLMQKHVLFWQKVMQPKLTDIWPTLGTKRIGHGK